MKRINSKFRPALILIFVIISGFSYAQSPKVWEWATKIEGTNKNFPYSICTDKEGNSYIAGGFTDMLKVGDIRLVSKGSFDIYLLKYNAEGNLIWAKQAGGSDSDEAYAIASDIAGNIYLTGYFSGEADFSGIHVKSLGDRDFFVTRYSPNGDPVWVKQGGGVSEDYSTAIATDNSGNVFITGIFRGSINLGNSNYVSKGDKDVFIIKYNNSGDIKWSTTGGGSFADESTSIAADKNGNCFVSGDFEGSAEFNRKMIVSSGKKDVFLAKYDSEGNIMWLKREGSATGDDHVSAIALDNSDNIFITGHFSGLAYFGKLELKNKGSDDIFLVKYNQDGDALWAKQTGGKGDEHARAIKLDKNGNVFLAGEFNADFTFGENNIRNIGDWDIFVIKYSNTGEMIGGTQISGAGYDKAYGIGLDSNANIYIVGFFSKTVSIGNKNLKSIDADDGFIAKLKSY